MDDLIVVRGVATETCPADRGVLLITARVKHSNSADAERALAELTSALDAVLDEFAAAVSARPAVHLSIRPNSYWHPESGRTVVDGYIGERGLRITVSDPAQVGTLIRALFTATPVEVSGPEWQLAQENPIHSQVRRAAARNARQRAEQYAEGLGLSVGAVAHVSEPGLRAEPRAQMSAMSLRADRSTGADMAAEPTVDLGSAEIEVSASVDVGFHIEPGS